MSLSPLHAMKSNLFLLGLVIFVLLLRVSTMGYPHGDYPCLFGYNYLQIGNVAYL